MTIEVPDGEPLELSSDYHGDAVPAVRILPGPFQGIGAGNNSLLLWPKSQ